MFGSTGARRAVWGAVMAATAAFVLVPLVAHAASDPQPTTTQLTAPATVLAWQPADFTATVRAASDSQHPSGTVAVREQGSPSVLATATLGPDATAKITVPGMSGGDHTLVAEYSGDSAFRPSTGSTKVTVQRYTLVASMNAPSSATQGSPATFAVAFNLAPGSPAPPSGRTPGGTVAFVVDNDVFATAGVREWHSSLTTSTLPSGSRTVVARYLGDDAFAPADTPPASVRITPAPAAPAPASGAGPAANVPTAVAGEHAVQPSTTRPDAVSAAAGRLLDSLPSATVPPNGATLDTAAPDGGVAAPAPPRVKGRTISRHAAGRQWPIGVAVLGLGGAGLGAGIALRRARA